MDDKTFEPLLEIKALSVGIAKHHYINHVLTDINLQVNSGDILAIVGESGSGKTMAMAAVMGLLPAPSARILGGDVSFSGINMLASGKARLQILRRDIAFITQNSLTSLNPVHKIGRQMMQMIAFRNQVSNREALESAKQWLLKVGIMDVERVLDAYPHSLSGGMRQRVIFAMAISSKPKLLIADEPTTALDTTTQKQVLDLLREINAEFGTAIIIISHDFGVVSYLSRQVAVMYRGKIVEHGETPQVLTSPRDEYTCNLIAAVPKLDLGVTEFELVEQP